MLLQILTNYLNASWETRYILDMWHRCVKRSRFVFFFSFPGFLFARLDPRDGDLGKGKSHRSTISLSCTHMDACDYQRLTISAWPLNGYLLEMKVTRFECQESIGDSISLSPPSILSTLFPWTRSELNVVDARYLRFVLKPRLSVNVERPGSSLND